MTQSRFFGFIQQMALSLEEAEFPLAFSIAMYRDVEQTERLLRAIYQPQNLYCIHVDTKSSLLIHRTVAAIARCFDNVWVATHLDKIKWGDVRFVRQSQIINHHLIPGRINHPAAFHTFIIHGSY